jgi:hypothetical protein
MLLTETVNGVAEATLDETTQKVNTIVSDKPQEGEDGEGQSSESM